MICPCKDCEFRHFGCHAQCVHYKAWREEKKTRVEDRILRNRPSEFLIDQRRKQRRRSHKRRK